MKKYVPWPIKMGIKLICSVLGLTKILQKLRVFEHGHHGYKKSVQIFNQHFNKVEQYLSDGFTVLELGPGYCLNTPAIAKEHGARFTYLVDRGEFAKKELENNYQYLVEGLESLKQIPDNAVDFVFSHVVLEHVFKNELFDTLKELKRITKHNGVHSHTIDLRDHLSSAKNHLRFSEKMWESRLFHNSGFYTNRIQYNDMLSLFEKAGFRYEIVHKDMFEDGSIAGFHVLLFSV